MYMKVKLNDPLRCGGQIPCTLEDRLKFKSIAAIRGISMVRLFHEWMMESDYEVV